MSLCSALFTICCTRVQCKPTARAINLAVAHTVGTHSENHRAKLPETDAVLSEVTESNEAFAIRRLRWAVTQIMKNGA